MLIAFAGLQGVGGAIVLPIGLTIVTSVFPPSRRGTAIGVLEGVTGLAVIAGPVVGGAVSHWLPWQWIFWINVPVALAAIFVVQVAVEETSGRTRRSICAGLLLVSVAATATVWALARANAVGWTSAEFIAAALTAFASAIAFVVWERRAPAPMLPRRLFRSRAFPLGVATAFFVAASLYVAVFFIVLVLVLATTTSITNSTTASAISATPIQPSTMPAVARPAPAQAWTLRIRAWPTDRKDREDRQHKREDHEPAIPSTSDAIALPLVPSADSGAADCRAPPTRRRSSSRPGAGGTGSPQPCSRPRYSHALRGLVWQRQQVADRDDPISFPWSQMGTCRKPPWIIIIAASPLVASGPTVIGSRVIHCSTLPSMVPRPTALARRARSGCRSDALRR